MNQTRGDQPAEPCICGSCQHQPIQDRSFSSSGSGVGFLRCPERPLPAYVTRGREELARGLCWAQHPASGLHCTLAPHGDDTDHSNAYAGQPWRAIDAH